MTGTQRTIRVDEEVYAIIITARDKMNQERAPRERRVTLGEALEAILIEAGVIP